MPIEFEMLRTTETPPGGYKWTEPTTGKTFEHYDYTAFTNAIRDFHIGNEIPLAPDWREQVKSDMCSQNRVKWGSLCRRVDAPKGVRPFSIEAAKSFVKFMAGWLSKGGGYVDQAEAERRAEICAGCEFNQVAVASCGSCYNAVLEAIHGIVGKRETKYSDKLESCKVCSCSNRVSVWMPLDAQLNALAPETKEQLSRLAWCWKKEPQG